MPTLTERRLGSLLGAAVGDSLGVTHEFKSAEDIPAGRFRMVGGGPFCFSPGAPSDDTDLLYVSLRAYQTRNSFEAGIALEEMQTWLAGDPADVGMQTAASLACWEDGSSPSPHEEAQGNGGLMRAAAHALACDSSATAAKFAFEDTFLTHPSKKAAEVSAFYASVLWRGLHGTEPSEAIRNAAADAPPWSAYSELKNARGGWCVHSLRLALWAYEASPSYESGMDAVIRSGGDTDTNATIAGALLGARFGIGGIPEDWLTALEQGNRDRLEDQARRLSF